MNNEYFNPSITYEKALKILLSLKPHQELTVQMLFKLKPEECEDDFPELTHKLVFKALADLPPSNLLYLNNLIAVCKMAEIEADLDNISNLDDSDLDDIPELDDAALERMMSDDKDENDLEERQKSYQEEKEARRNGTYVDPRKKPDTKSLLFVPDANLTISRALIDFEQIIEARRSHRTRFDMYEDGNDMTFSDYSSIVKYPLVQFIMEKLEMPLVDLLVFDVCLSYAIKGRTSDIEDITNRYKLNKMAGLEIIEVLERLQDRGLITCEDSMRSHFNYSVSKDVVLAISRNTLELLPKNDTTEQLSIAAFLKKIRDKFKVASRSSYTINQAYDSLRILRNRTAETFKFWETVSTNTNKEQMLLLSCLDCYVINANVFNINDRNYEFLNNGEESFDSWNFEETVKALKIYEDGLIEECGDTLLEENEFSICLTEKGIKLFFEDATPIQYTKSKTRRASNLIYPDKLVKKDLHYPQEIRPQIEDLLKILNKDNTLRLSTKLTEMGFKTGITVLLSGAPGTGKSESVYQIAKLTDRAIFMVDISTIKDKWVGESEKNVKQIFLDYERARATCEYTPILLINEADALLSKRITVERSVDQTYNAMQNIFLQCIEDFNGILMATTNLVGNLDTAFDRRFLFKIKFQTPNEEVRRQIWLSHFSQEQLAPILDKLSQIALSGGEIANCVKRYQLEVLLDRANSIESLLILAEGETSVRKTNAIGFSK